MPNPAFELSIDVRILSERLAKVGTGETITYTDLGSEVKAAVDGGTPALQSALGRVFKSGIVFENVRGIGYKRLSDIDIVSASERDMKSVRRKAKRSASKLTKVADFAALPQDKKIEHNARLSILSAVAQQTSRASEARVIEAVKINGRELPFAATLDAFRKSA